MKNIIQFSLAVASTLLSLTTWGQNVDFDKDNFPKHQKEAFKRAKKEFEKGLDLYLEGPQQYKNVLRHLRIAHEFNPNNAEVNFVIGECIMIVEEKKDAIPFLEKAFSLDPNIDPDIDYYLARAYHYNEEWDKAIDWYQKQIDLLKSRRNKKNFEEVTAEIENCQHSIQQCNNGKILVKNPVRIFVDNMGATLNSPYPEFGSIVSADESTMIFTSRRPGSTGSKTVNEAKAMKKDLGEQDYMEDIYITYKDANGNWGTPQNIGKPINDDGHDATVYLSSDAQSMIFYRSDKHGGGLYTSELKGDKWTKPKNLGKNINTDYHETTASYSPDKKTLYFVSDKPDDNYGGHDIFVSQWNEKKERWGEAKNLGPTINTKYDEEGVFIHPDGETMYFSSKGHNSMGEYDIFYSKLVNGKWSKPVNMGYPVNGADNDVFLVMSADKRTGYYSSVHKDGYGSRDLYLITFLGAEKEVISNTEDNLLASLVMPISEKVIEPTVQVSQSKTTIVKGIVIDAVTRKPVEAKIVLTDNKQNKEVATFTSNSATGKFLLSLPSGRNYGIAVENPNYLFHSENFDIPDTALYQQVYKEIRLKNISVGTKIVLKNIFFDTDKATLRDESIPELKRLLELLNEVPSMKIEIGGHTDSVGSDSYNQGLSQRRAQAVVKYLTTNGINASRLTSKGYGEKEPIATNDTDKGRQENRRTEFKILSK
ncbi:MAG: OmpA family protein [Cytophagales bacterium]|nr:OmpA family protein [Cytophagales bacterium]